MKKLALVILTLILLVSAACSSNTSGPKKISLSDATEILDISSVLPASFKQVDAASEGMSKEDMQLGSYCSEVQLFLSEDPFQMVYGFMAIIGSSIEGAVFDRQLEDDEQMKTMIKEAILSGAQNEGVEAAVPDLQVFHPEMGDSCIYGRGSLESYGYFFGFDILSFRTKKVYIFMYSFSMSENEVDLQTISREIERRVGTYSQ